MKKTAFFYVTITIITMMLLQGCTSAQPVTNSEPPQNSHIIPDFRYNKYKIDFYTANYIRPLPELYQAVFDAVDNFEPQVDLGGQVISPPEAENIAAAVLARYEFTYINGIALSPDGTAINMLYRPEFTKETAAAAKNAFRDKVKFILRYIANPQYTALENVIAVYTYFCHCTYNENADDVGCYGLMVNKEGICTGYAYALRYILDQLDIPSYLAFSTDQSHVWNIVKLGDCYYHLDATWDSLNQSPTPKMNFFGMTDAQRQTDFDSWYGGGNSAYERYT
ncbi:MAG: hypothetical protein RR332_03330, partial [Clostridiales bacterium]